MSLQTNKLLTTLVLSCLLPISIQNSQASSSFNGDAYIYITIDNLSNLNNPGEFIDLEYNWSSLHTGYEDTVNIINSGNSVFTPYYYDSGLNHSELSVYDNFSSGFNLSGTADDTAGGTASAYYEASSLLEFTNRSSTDTFKIDFQVGYIISSSAESDFKSPNDLADTDTFLDFYNANGSFNWNASTYASALSQTFDTTSRSFTRSILLSPNSTDGLYASSSISGTLQASPVPVPTAIWLFGSALLSLTGMRKLKK